MRKTILFLLSATASMLPGCSSVKPSPSSAPAIYQEGVLTDSGEPAYITVQHCLIGFRGSVPSKRISRSRQEAEQLAQELFEQAKAGADFDQIVSANTDDSPPGIYQMANYGFPADMSSQDLSQAVFARDKMVPAFGNTGFPLEVGEVGLAAFDEQNSRYGWHIVKRLK